MSLFISLMLAGIVFVICSFIDGDKLKELYKCNILFGVVAFLLSFFICPMAAIAFLMAAILTEALHRTKITDSVPTTVLVLIVSAIVLIVIFCAFVPALYSVPHTNSRELTKEQQLVAIGENVRFAGRTVFLTPNIKQEDYYDYRYTEGAGYRNSRISKFSPYIEENSTLKDTGRMLFYQRYETYQAQSTWDQIWEFLYNPKGKIAQGSEEVEIYVPNGTVDKTIGI